MTKTTLLISLLVWSAACSVPAHEPVMRARTPVNIPNPPGYVTLKCDFHIHTVFSDGTVWPSVRAEEAWREGLDVIAITDHIEYQPHTNDITTNHNRSYEIARGAGAGLEVMVIKGSEITRKMPPGHLNAIFLTNSASLAVSNWQDAIRAAHVQGAFIFWNHPGWEEQTTNGVVRWYPEHSRILEQKMMHGIEVVNGRSYYPEAHRWATDKKLTMLSNSDIHAPLNMDYQVYAGDHRPMTLVFAKERTAEALKKALFNRQTAVYAGDRLIGEERFLRPIFERSIRLNKKTLEIKGKQRVYAQISNTSDIDYQLVLAMELDEIRVPRQLILAGRKTVLLDVQGKSTTAEGRKTLKLPYRVSNLLIGPDEPLPVRFTLKVSFTPAPPAAM